MHCKQVTFELLDIFKNKSEVLERKTVLGYQSMGSEAKIIALCKPTTGRLYRATGLPDIQNSNFHTSSEAELCLFGSKV